MSRYATTVLVAALLMASCSSSDGDDNERITRIDGPAVVNDEDEE